MTAPKADLERFIREHGPVVIAGESEVGPVLELADGATVFVPMAGDEFFFTLPPSP